MLGRDFIEILNLSAEELQEVLSLSARCKENPAVFGPARRGSSAALLFEKPSLRTKASFSAGLARLGLASVWFGPEEVGLGKRESVADAARNLDRFFDLLIHRTFGHDKVLGLAQHSAVPVVNALSDHEHPCQALADLLTLRERFGRLEGLKVAWIGDGNNVAHSLLGACALVGIELALATPPTRQPDPVVVADALQVSRAGICLHSDPVAAVTGAHCVYTDTWASMGQESEAAARRIEFADYQVDSALMARARPDAVFLHCLPAHRGEEVTDEVMDSPASVIFQQAGNRLPTQQALMALILGLV